MLCDFYGKVIVEPTEVKHDAGSLTDDNDLEAIYHAAINGYGLATLPVDETFQSLQRFTRHRGNLVKQRAKLQIQNRYSRRLVPISVPTPWCRPSTELMEIPNGLSGTYPIRDGSPRPVSGRGAGGEGLAVGRFATEFALFFSAVPPHPQPLLPRKAGGEGSQRFGS